MSKKTAARPMRWSRRWSTTKGAYEHELKVSGGRLGGVFLWRRDPDTWHFYAVDGRNTNLSGEPGFGSSAAAKEALLKHVKAQGLREHVLAHKERQKA